LSIVPSLSSVGQIAAAHDRTKTKLEPKITPARMMTNGIRGSILLKGFLLRYQAKHLECLHMSEVHLAKRFSQMFGTSVKNPIDQNTANDGLVAAEMSRYATVILIRYSLGIIFGFAALRC
jgi:hypothetical protein